ncbi:MAG: glycosyltransferase [Terriglobia bacterium]
MIRGISMSHGKEWEHLRVALVHHWLVKMRGGEKVLESLCRLFPKADIFTLVCEPGALTDRIKNHPIRTSWLQKIPGIARHYRNYLPLFPLAVESFDLTDYDLVLSSDASLCKGVLTQPGTCHICYCHSPMRSLWNGYHEFLTLSGNPWQKRFLPLVAHYLRTWDYHAASRVDYFISNSRNVAQRIGKFYGRDSTVIYPPIRIKDFQVTPQPHDFFLAAGELTPYKRFDLAIAAFNRLGLPLWVAGDGVDARRLQKMAGNTIRFLGWISSEQLRSLQSRCRALILPGEEDFGMTVPETHASGRPVIALGKGGSLETILPYVNGLCFMEDTIDALCEALREFEKIETSFDPAEIRQSALKFDETRFFQQIQEFVSTGLVEHRQRNTVQTAVPVEVYQRSLAN